MTKYLLRYHEVWANEELPPNMPEDSFCQIQLIVHHVDAMVPDRLGLRFWFFEEVDD